MGKVDHLKVKKMKRVTEAATRGVFFKKETPAQVFSCEFFEIFKDPFFTENFRTNVSEGPRKYQDA